MSKLSGQSGSSPEGRNKNFNETFPELAEWYDSLEIDMTIPDVRVTDGRITHFEPGVYISDKENYNK